MNKICNIGMVDVRKVSRKLAGEISEFTNIGTYITSDEAELILSNVSKKNIDAVIKCDEDVELINMNGEYKIDQGLLDGLQNKVYINVNGQLIISEDVKIESLREKILAGSVNGMLTAPKTILGTVQALFSVNGPVVSYDEDMIYFSNNLILNDESLIAHFGPSKIAVSTLIATDEIDMRRFKDSYDKIQVLRDLVIVDTLLNDLKPYLKVDGKVKVLTSPVYYLRGDADLTLDLVENAGDSNIHVTGQLTCLDEKAIDALTSNIEAKKIVTNKVLLSKIKQHCKSMQKIVLIEDLPRENYTSLKINKAYLSNLNKKQRLDNYGSLEFDKTLKADDFEGVEFKIKNFGVMNIPEHLEGVVFSFLTENYGTLSKNEKGESKSMYSNLGSLVL